MRQCNKGAMCEMHHAGEGKCYMPYRLLVWADYYLQPLMLREISPVSPASGDRLVTRSHSMALRDIRACISERGAKVVMLFV